MRLVLLCLLMLLPFGSLDAQIIPTPRSDTPALGRFVLDDTTVLSYADELAPLAGYLLQYLPLTSGRNVSPTRRCIALSLDDTLPAEGYRLTIREERIELAGGTGGGAFYAVQSLLQLLPAEVYAGRCPLPVELDCRTIADAPAYAYRGMHLDVARTWMEGERLKRMIDLLAHHKINKLHLHLADDEGWRIEIHSHPELAAIGGFRGGDSPVAPVYGKWGEKYGGYYTQEQMRSLIEYAALRNVEIIPEIDLPGHSRCIGSLHPEIRCAYPTDTAATAGTDYRSAWCVAREENYTLLEDILDEICALFPSEYIHIGGDEVEVSLPGFDATAADRRPAPAARPLHGSADRHADGPRQAPGRVERSGCKRGIHARKPRARLGERRSLPQSHCPRLSHGHHAERVFLFRHASDTPRGGAQLGFDLRRPQDLRIRSGTTRLF